MFKKIFLGLALAAGFASAAGAADLPRRYAAPAPAYIETAPAPIWDGLYFGLTGGYAFAGKAENTHQVNSNFGGVGGTYGGDPDGGVIGAHIGFNHQMNSWLVWGAELGLNKSYLKGSDNYPQYFNDTGTEIEYYGTAKLRFGVAFDRVLLYVNGGYAGGRIGLTQTYAPPFAAPTTFSQSTFHHGWTLGAGVEYALTRNVILRGEYEYLRFNAKAHSALDNQGVLTVISNKTDAHVAKAGVSFKF